MPILPYKTNKNCTVPQSLRLSAALFQLRTRVNLPFPSSPFLPLFPFPFLSLPSPYLSPTSPSSPRSGPRQKQLVGLGSSVRPPSDVRSGTLAAVAFCCIVCSQNASGCSISGSLVSTAMCGKMKANPIQAPVESGISLQLTHLPSKSFKLVR